MDERLDSIRFEDLSSLLNDIYDGHSNVSVLEISKNIESLWKGEILKTSDFAILYNQLENCKRKINMNRSLDQLIALQAII